MTSFFLRLFAVCAAGILAETLTDAFGSGSKIVKTVSALCLLLTLGAVFLRLPEAVGANAYSSSVFFETSGGSAPDSTLAVKTAELMKKRLADDIFKETGISPQDVRIDYTTAKGDALPHLVSVSVVMPHGKKLTETYIQSLSRYLGCTVRVTYGPAKKDE